jgi:hypothetical protein
MNFKYTITDNQYTVIDDVDNRYIVYQINDSNLGELRGLFNSYISLLANENDLTYARQYIDQMFFSENTTLIDGALINSSIQILIKCFTNPAGKGRSQLDAQKVFDKFAQNTGRASYIKQYHDFYNIRIRSLAHDENDYKDNIVGLTVDTQNHKPVEIGYIKVRSKFLYKQNADILREMISVALEYINAQKQELEKRLIEHFSQKPISEILEYKILDCNGVELSNSW